MVLAQLAADRDHDENVIYQFWGRGDIDQTL
jgi:hypothetical protein